MDGITKASGFRAYLRTGSRAIFDMVLPFHLIIAPPLPGAADAAPRAGGARHMTALLASKVAGVVAIGLLTHERAASIYEAGRLTLSETF